MNGEVVAAPHTQCHMGVLWHPDLKALDWTARPWHLWHGLGVVTLDIGARRPLRVAVTHLSPWDPQHRLADARTIAGLLATSEHATIVAGDWNTIGENPRYDPEPDLSTLSVAERIHHVAWPADPNQPPLVDRRPARLLTDAGLTDIASSLGIPWQPTTGHLGREPRRRIDAFRVSSPVLPAVTDYEVLDTPLTRTLSDHVPIRMVIDGDALLAPKPLV
jgi:endonuclease/exonuclease/phosphatase family metal-dependent hydrolase